jgi:hypothetical protein
MNEEKVAYVNFRIKDGSYVEFDLFVDGHPIRHRQIYIGNSGWHPDDHSFRLDRF